MEGNWGQIFGVGFANFFAGDVCFDDPRSFSIIFHPCVSRLLARQKRGSLSSFVSLKIAAVLVDPVAPREWQCRGGKVDAVQLVAVLCSLNISIVFGSGRIFVFKCFRLFLLILR